MNEPFKKINSKKVYKGRVIDVRVDTIVYKDKHIDWEIVEMGNAVVIVPMIDEETFVLLHQYRYTAGTFIWEFPAGRAEDGEDFELSAQRELEEECGYRAHSLKKVMMYYPSPGVITEKMHLYFATDLYEARGLQPDHDEIISVKHVKASEIAHMIKNGEIVDAKTILAFYYYQLHKHELA